MDTGTVTGTGTDMGTGDKLVELHESIASLLASRGEWQQAYQHLRSALDLISESQDQPPIPEQLRREVDRLRREHAEAREQSLRDGLTDSYNRRYLDQRLVTLFADAAATPHGVAVALVDLDWFKRVNDTFGHLTGDRVLQRVVELLTAGLPSEGFCARYGGEEFVLVLPGVAAAAAVEFTESARSRIEHYPWSQVARGLRVTVSVGLAYESAAANDGGIRSMDAEHQLFEADTLLYTAKLSGRNAVAYRGSDGVQLAGAAADRRSVTQPAIATAR
ncbi:MAG: GGDEF domain-containing protein [Sciscionella sp.]